MKQYEYIFKKRDWKFYLSRLYNGECMSPVADSRKWRTLDEEVCETVWIAGKSITQSRMNNLSSSGII